MLKKKEEIKQELIEQGLDIEDFNINVTENGYSITPKWFYEQKQIAKQEDKPIKDDVQDVAITTAYVLEDTMTTAETVALLFIKISELEAEIEMLKGGNK